MSLAELGPYFGLKARPFRSDLAPSALAGFGAHAEAKARIAYLVEEGALGLITGEVGSGRTTAVRAAVSVLDRSRHSVVYLPNPSIGVRGIYAEIVAHLGEEPRFHTAGLIVQTQELLARERSERKKQVVVIVDEAHLLGPSQLEQLRLLTNAEMDSQAPFAGILVGQPQLRRRLRTGTFAALDQRIALRYELGGMDLGESSAYLDTTFGSPDGRIGCSLMMRPSCCTSDRGGCRARSTISRRRRWWRPMPRTSRSSMRRRRRRRRRRCLGSSCCGLARIGV